MPSRCLGIGVPFQWLALFSRQRQLRLKHMLRVPRRFGASLLESKRQATACCNGALSSQGARSRGFCSGEFACALPLGALKASDAQSAVSYTHLRAHETSAHL
eukprot:15311984-Alexandrium_andersonii.AAC.1